MAINFLAGDYSLQERLAWRSYEETAHCKIVVLNRAQFDLAQEIGRCQETGKYIFYDSSANAQGKTANLMNILANIIFGRLNIYRNITDIQTGEKFDSFYNGALYEQWPKGWPKRIWYTSHIKNLDEAFEEFRKWMPVGSYKEEKKSTSYVAQMTFTNGWVWEFKTRDQDPEAFESGNVGIWIADEPPKEWQYNGAHFRVRMGGIIIITATPVLESAFLFEKIADPIDAGYGEDKYYQTTAVWNNSLSKGGEWDLGRFGVQMKGNLTDESIERMKRNCDEDEAPARLWGKGIHLSGRVFTDFTEDNHVVPPRPLHPVEYIWFIIDPHRAKPPFCQWWAISHMGRYVNLREQRFLKVGVEQKTRRIWMPYMRCVLEFPQYERERGYEMLKETSLTVSEFCEIILQVEHDWDFTRRLKRRLMDPKFGQEKIPTKREGAGLRTIRELYANNGISCAYPPVHEISYRHGIIRECLKCEDGGQPVQPIVTWEEHCINSTRAMRNYAWVQPRILPDDKERASETRKLTEKWKHPVDLVGYLIDAKPQREYRDEHMPKSWQERLAAHEMPGQEGGSWDPMAH
jgi:phage terminase large subunit-like protein